jgi:hypothetical protein
MEGAELAAVAGTQGRGRSSRRRRVGSSGVVGRGEVGPRHRRQVGSGGDGRCGLRREKRKRKPEWMSWSGPEFYLFLLVEVYLGRTSC